MSASSGSAKVNAKQQLAIDVLLVGGTDAQAATAAGVSRSTVAHWRRNVPAFAEAFRTARREMLQRTRTRLHAGTAVAVKALEDIAKDPQIANARGAAPRVSAARAIIELSQKAYEHDELEVRLKALEESINADKERGRS